MSEQTTEADILRAFYEGVLFAYNHPGEQPGTPWREPLLSAYYLGIDSGRNGAAGLGFPAESAGQLEESYQGPAIGPYNPDGRSWEEYQRELQEMLEPLFHEHMPHIEIETFEMPPVPPTVAGASGPPPPPPPAL